MQMITCPICKTEHVKSNLKKFESDCHFMEIENINQHLIRYQCNVCDVIFGPEDMLKLESEKLLKYYQDMYNLGRREMDDSALEFTLFKMLNPNKDGVYINWGAGTSNSSKMASDEGYTLLNYDPGMPDSLEYLSKNNLPKVDGIISNNVLDHLQDPISDMLLMKSLLNDGASMIHASDGFDYSIHYTKVHLFFFVGKSVEFISKEIGMAHTPITSPRGGVKIYQWK